MASLTQRLNDVFTAIGQDIKSINTALSGVSVGSKGNVVVNINDDYVELAVTGQANISTTSAVTLVLTGATADHDEDAHLLANHFVKLSAGNIIAGTGFTIKIANEGNTVSGLFNVNWSY